MKSVQARLTDDGKIDFDVAAVRAAAVSDALRPLKTALIRQREADELVVDAMGYGSAAGASWAEIARVLGCSKQAAWQRYNSAVLARSLSRK